MTFFFFVGMQYIYVYMYNIWLCLTRSVPNVYKCTCTVLLIDHLLLPLSLSLSDRVKEYQPGDELKQTANELVSKVDDPKLQNTEVVSGGLSAYLHPCHCLL